MSAETAAMETTQPLELSDALPMREERLFLLLSIFIGILSGLAGRVVPDGDRVAEHSPAGSRAGAGTETAVSDTGCGWNHHCVCSRDMCFPACAAAA